MKLIHVLASTVLMGSTLAHGQTFQVADTLLRDSNGHPIVRITSGTVSYSDPAHLAKYRGIITNVSPLPIDLHIVGTVVNADGYTITFEPQLLSNPPENVPFYSDKDRVLKPLPTLFVQNTDYEIACIFPESDHIVVAQIKSVSVEIKNADYVKQTVDRYWAQQEELKKRELTEQLAEERAEALKVRRLRDRCWLIYRVTIDKRQGDLTVREATLVKACTALDLYPPD